MNKISEPHAVVPRTGVINRNLPGSVSSFLLMTASVLLLAGCAAEQGQESISQSETTRADTSPERSSQRKGSLFGGTRNDKPSRVLAVRCLYDARPWLSFDRENDRDPEGLKYRVFLDVGGGETVIRDGTFHVELYRLDRQPDGSVARTLASDWHFETSRAPQIQKPGMLGEGYFFFLRWAFKDIAGNEIEISTEYEDPYGRTARSETKRMRVPKYTG